MPVTHLCRPHGWGGHLKTTTDLQVLLCSPEFKILPCLDPRALPGFLDTKGLCTCCFVGPGCGQQPGKLPHTRVTLHDGPHLSADKRSMLV